MARSSRAERRASSGIRRRRVRWNADKRYLLDLDARGVATIPTRIVSRGRLGEVERIVAEEAWPRFVIKPAVSASGFETYALDAPIDASARETIARVVSAGDVLVQPFADEIPRDGEILIHLHRRRVQPRDAQARDGPASFASRRSTAAASSSFVPPQRTDRAGGEDVRVAAGRFRSTRASTASRATARSS